MACAIKPVENTLGGLPLGKEQKKRRQKAFNADWGDFGQHKVEGPDKREDLFNKIVDRVKKQHPEMKNIKARRYARTQDPIGRKFQRLKNQGYDVATISKN